MINIDKNELQILWDDGFSIKDIAEHFACDTSVVRRVLKSMDIACDRKSIMERKYRIERNKKWTDVKSMLDGGMPINKIVDALDMTYLAVQDLIKEHDYVYNPDKHLISDEYKNQLIALRKNHSVKEIAKILNKSERTIERHLSNFGLTVATDRQDIKDADVISAWEDGMSINQIATKFDCSHETVTKRLNYAGISNSRADGIRRHFASTYEARWSGIKADLENGASIRYLRDKYKIRVENLRELLRNHGYYYGNENTINRIDRLIDTASDDRMLRYLNAIRDYIIEFEELPTRRDLSERMNTCYSNVAKAIKQYDFGTFVRHNVVSSYVIRVTETLDEYGIEYELNNRSVLDGKELDIWIPDLKIGIEVNPFSTHSIDSGVGITSKNYHQDKSVMGIEKRIALVHLYDEDFIDEDRYNKIMYLICHKPSIRIGARKCCIKPVSVVHANMFLNQYHIQGGEHSSSDRLGLYYNDMLVGLLTYGKSRFAKADVEIIRYCMHPDYAVVGSFAKLFKCMKSNLGKNAVIVSYMDLNKRFRPKSVYELNGFVCEEITAPDYVWVDSHGSKVLKRYDTMKSRLVADGYDASLTEVQIMRSRHYFRVFGAGSKRYVWRGDNNDNKRTQVKNKYVTI